MKNLKTCLLLALTSTFAWAAPNVQATTVSADAQGDTRRPVIVTVMLENKGNEPFPGGQSVLTLTPKTPPSMRSQAGNTMFDPMSIPQPLQTLAPGEKITLKYETPFLSRNSFKGQRGTFRASNIDPTGGDVVVSFGATIQAGVARPR